MDPTSTAIRPLVKVYASLLALLALSATAAILPPGPWKAPTGLIIAFIKAAIIFIYFMKLRAQGWLVRSIALVGLVWLAIAIALIMSDYLSRSPF